MSIVITIGGGIVTAIIIAYYKKRQSGKEKLKLDAEEKEKEALEYSTLKLKIGVVSYVSSREEGIIKIKNDLITSEKIFVLNFAGSSMLDKMMTHNNVLCQIIEESKTIRKIRFLVLDCKNATDYVEERFEGLAKFSTVEKQDSLNGKVVDMTIEQLKRIKSFFTDKSIDYQCRLFNEVLKWSLIFSDTSILCTFYPKGQTGFESSGIIIKRNSLLGESFEKYFNDLWEKRSSKVEIV